MRAEGWKDAARLTTLPCERAQHHPQDGKEARPRRCGAERGGAVQPVHSGHRGHAASTATAATQTGTAKLRHKRRIVKHLPSRKKRQCSNTSPLTTSAKRGRNPAGVGVREADGNEGLKNFNEALEELRTIGRTDNLRTVVDVAKSLGYTYDNEKRVYVAQEA